MEGERNEGETVRRSVLGMFEKKKIEPVAIG